MSTDPDTILLEAEDAMDKAVEYLKQELRGVRSGRASTALIEFIKVDYYGSSTELKALAAISVPEPTQLLIKPFDQSAVGEIRKAIEAANLGLTPVVEDKAIRISVPPLSADRRQQLVARCKKMGEEAKVVLRNARREANKHADALAKDPDAHISEDQIADLKDQIQEMLKKYEAEVDRRVAEKSKEVLEV
ncbi:MAG: ribosome-recycling factor [Phycisphaerales bacterium]|nr:MAG: ribosome-recycling factor [Phycisphaerales bacterium]